MSTLDETRQTRTMPIRLDAIEEGDGAFPVKPDSNAHELLTVLAEHPDLGFTASELAELTDVSEGSVGKTLSRLEGDGLARNLGGYWALAEEFEASSVANLVSLAELEERSDDVGDAFDNAER